MNHSQPGTAPESTDAVPGDGAERTEISDADVQAKGDAEVAAVVAAREAGDVAEADIRAMTDHVMDKSDPDAGTCFGVPVPSHLLPVEVARMLCEIKASKGLPVENLPDAVVGPLLVA